ncbi:MAG: hypothetical protein P4L71_20135 [Acetobacteraceae bacterium]|nr:hypothetical protein [Acetobacteraceae bacterium]
MVTLSSATGAFVVGASPIEEPETGSQADFVNRMLSVLPGTWFPDSSPVLVGVLSGIANIWASLYALLQWVIAQARISTATGVTLDMVAVDFFGSTLTRGGMTDTAFRSAILAGILRQGGIRAGMIAQLTSLTGTAPVIIESERPADTGVLGGSNVGIGYAGGGTGYSTSQATAGVGYWGTRDPEQVFIRVTPGSATSAEVFSTIKTMQAAGSVVWVNNA